MTDKKNSIDPQPLLVKFDDRQRAVLETMQTIGLDFGAKIGEGSLVKAAIQMIGDDPKLMKKLVIKTVAIHKARYVKGPKQKIKKI